MLNFIETQEPDLDTRVMNHNILKNIFFLGLRISPKDAKQTYDFIIEIHTIAKITKIIKLKSIQVRIFLYYYQQLLSYL